MKIKSGDTLSQIAKSKGMTLKSLLAANPSIKNANQIKVGQNIVIPPKSMQAGSASKNPYEGMTRTEMNMLNHKNKNKGAQEAVTRTAQMQQKDGAGRTSPNTTKANKVKASKPGSIETLKADAMAKVKAAEAKKKKQAKVDKMRMGRGAV